MAADKCTVEFTPKTTSTMQKTYLSYPCTNTEGKFCLTTLVSSLKKTRHDVEEMLNKCVIEEKNNSVAVGDSARGWLVFNSQLTCTSICLEIRN